MALTPSHTDENRKEVLAEIKKLEKEGNAQAADELKEKFNMGEKQRTVVVSPAAANAMTNK